VTSSKYPNDGDPVPCFVIPESEWWKLELGANVRVALVFIENLSWETLTGFDISVGECVLSKASCIFCLLLFGSFIIIDQYHVFRTH